MFKALMDLVFWAMVVLGAGSLIEITAELRQEAAKAHMRGTLELGKWSRKLNSP